MAKSIFDDDTPANYEVPPIGAADPQQGFDAGAQTGGSIFDNPQAQERQAQSPQEDLGLTGAVVPPPGVQRVEPQQEQMEVPPPPQPDPRQLQQPQQIHPPRTNPTGPPTGGGFTPPQQPQQPQSQSYDSYTGHVGPVGQGGHGQAGFDAPAGQTNPNQTGFGGPAGYQAPRQGVTSLAQLGQRQPSLQGQKVTGGSAFMALKFGDQVNRFPIPRMKYSEGKRELITMISEDMYGLRYHYFEGFGQVYCTQGLCCRLDGTPPVRFGIPVAVILTDPQGNPIQPLRADVKLHVVGEEAYESLKAKSDMYGGLIHKLIQVNCTDDKYQKLELTVFPDVPLETEAAELLRSMQTYYQQHKGSIMSAIAKNVDDNLLAAALGYDGGVVNEAMRRGQTEDLKRSMFGNGGFTGGGFTG